MAASERQKLPSLLDKLARKQRSMREYRESSGAPSIVFQQADRVGRRNLTQLEENFPSLNSTKEEVTELVFLLCPSLKREGGCDPTPDIKSESQIAS